MSGEVHDDPEILRVLDLVVAGREASDADIMRLIHGVDEHARASDLMSGGRCLLEAVVRLAT